MAEQVPAVCSLLTSIESADWASVCRQLSADIHWTNAIEEHRHGPDEVLAMLQRDPPPAPPAYHERFDGLITRWIDSPG